MSSDSALSVLFGAYLNQDVFDFYADEFEAARDFARQDPELATSLPSEVADLLRDADDQTVAAQLNEKFRLEIEPRDMTYREWLTKIADHVSTATASGA